MIYLRAIVLHSILSFKFEIDSLLPLLVTLTKWSIQLFCARLLLIDLVTLVVLVETLNGIIWILCYFLNCELALALNRALLTIRLLSKLVRLRQNLVDILLNLLS